MKPNEGERRERGREKGGTGFSSPLPPPLLLCGAQSFRITPPGEEKRFGEGKVKLIGGQKLGEGRGDRVNISLLLSPPLPQFFPPPIVFSPAPSLPSIPFQPPYGICAILFSPQFNSFSFLVLLAASKALNSFAQNKREEKRRKAEGKEVNPPKRFGEEYVYPTEDEGGRDDEWNGWMEGRRRDGWR